jgi:hypothetical protein
MNRYRGGTKTSLIERKFPHHVEMIVPEGGFGKRLDAMHDWHRARHIRALHGRRRDADNRDYIVWCFLEREIAEAFASEFSGRS